MIIRFDDIELSIIPNFKGGEKHLAANMFFDGTNRILKGVLEPGASIGVHTHEGTCEMIFILEGKGQLFEKTPDGHETLTDVNAGDCLYCPEGYTHSLINPTSEEDLKFYAVVPKQDTIK